MASNSINIIALLVIAVLSWITLCWINLPLNKTDRYNLNYQTETEKKIDTKFFWITKILDFFGGRNLNLIFYSIFTFFGVFILINVVMAKIKAVTYLAANQECRTKYFEELTKLKYLNNSIQETMNRQKQIFANELQEKSIKIQELRKELMKAHSIINCLKYELETANFKTDFLTKQKQNSLTLFANKIVKTVESLIPEKKNNYDLIDNINSNNHVNDSDETEIIVKNQKYNNVTSATSESNEINTSSDLDLISKNTKDEVNKIKQHSSNSNSNYFISQNSVNIVSTDELINIKSRCEMNKAIQSLDLIKYYFLTYFKTFDF